LNRVVKRRTNYFKTLLSTVCI